VELGSLLNWVWCRHWTYIYESGACVQFFPFLSFEFVGKFSYFHLRKRREVKIYLCLCMSTCLVSLLLLLLNFPSLLDL